MTTALDQISAADFRALPDNAIPLVQGGRNVALEVVEVRELARHAERAQPPFTLVLRENGARQALPQGIFHLVHPRLGALDLFAVPIGPDDKGMRYEIIFN